MKMKVKTLACLCALAAIPAFGTEAVTSANTFGVLKVECSAKKVIIATPWIECGGSGSVKVTDLVMTANLDQGDTIITYEGGTFKGWILDSDKAWQPLLISSSDSTSAYGSVVSSGAAGGEAIARGQAFWFVKNGYTSGSYDLYLYGQDTSAAATSTVVAGTSGSPAYSLVASPKTTEADLNTVGTFGFTPNAADEIRVPRYNLPDLVYTYKATESGWGTSTKQLIEGSNPARYKKVWTKGCTIPAGTGFWYVSKGGSGTITW